MQNLLRGPHSDEYIQTAAKFASSGSKTDFEKLVSLLKSQDLAKWTLVTYLPYMWQPDTHMYLKPEATKDFAERVGYPLAQVYEAKPQYDVYQSLLDLVMKTEASIKNLNPRDKIDIQSFIWGVGNYSEST